MEKAIGLTVSNIGEQWRTNTADIVEPFWANIVARLFIDPAK